MGDRTIRQTQVLSEYKRLFYKKALGSITKEEFESDKHRLQNEMTQEGLTFGDGQEAKEQGLKEATIYFNGISI